MWFPLPDKKRKSVSIRVIKLKVLVAIFSFNEGEKIVKTLERFPSEYKKHYDIMICDDGSTDGSVESLNTKDIQVLRHATNKGVGAMMKDLFNYSPQNLTDCFVYHESKQPFLA